MVLVPRDAPRVTVLRPIHVFGYDVRWRGEPGLLARRGYAHQRTVRIVDGPDEVRRNAIAKIELGKRGLAWRS